jgi:hypothetical protein
LAGAGADDDVATGAGAADDVATGAGAADDVATGAGADDDVATGAGADDDVATGAGAADDVATGAGDDPLVGDVVADDDDPLVGDVVADDDDPLVAEVVADPLDGDAVLVGSAVRVALPPVSGGWSAGPSFAPPVTPRLTSFFRGTAQTGARSASVPLPGSNLKRGISSRRSSWETGISVQ